MSDDDEGDYRIRQRDAQLRMDAKRRAENAALLTQADRHRDELLAENAALRTLLSNARDCLVSCKWPWPIIADIDAALKEGKQ